ncbi:MAG: DUF4197 domain-containing protein [Gammaproteobacteria bacterium]|nr:DUF4197 domain-containing protein [Gammaproteobacteria bacterium]
MNHRAILGLLLPALFIGHAAQAGFGDMLKSAEGLLGGSTTQAAGKATASSTLSDSQINAGLKEALSIGAERAVGVLGKDGGFLNDASVKIPLPGSLDTVASGLRMAGQGKYVDDFERTVNRAAEQAVPATLEIVQDTVSNMTLDDVRGILAGGDDAATRFLQERAGGSMRSAILPIVSQATDQAGATAAYKALVDQAGGAVGGLGSLGGLLNTGSLDLDSYVTDKAMDGLFLKLAAEEKKIRENPLARSTDLLKSVFGS